MSLSKILLILLGLVVITSKELFIYNEEFLVLVAFVTFIWFAYDSIKEVTESTLDERAEKIEKDLSHFKQVKKQVLLSLVTYHEKQQSISTEIALMVTFIKDTIKQVISNRQQALSNTIVEETQKKLNTIAIKEAAITQELQARTSEVFTQNVLSAFKADNLDNTTKLYKDILLNESIDSINTLARMEYTDGTKEQLNLINMINQDLHVPVDVVLLALLKNKTI